MKQLMQTNSRNGAVSLENVVDQLFNNSLRRFFDENLWDLENSSSQGSVPVNMRENDQQYEVDVIAPGCRKEDFSLQVQNNELRISFAHNEKKQEADEKAGWVRNEFVQHSFTRSFSLDDTVQAENISATYSDGILKIVLPKTEKAKPRQLSISVK